MPSIASEGRMHSGWSCSCGAFEGNSSEVRESCLGFCGQYRLNSARRYVYEWGEATAKFTGGKSIVDRYLTVWQEQPDGTWKVIRNLVIPK